MKPEDVLEYWFGRGGWSEAPKWFMGGEAVDQEVRERFGSTIEAAVAGELDDWADRPDGAAALVVVLDQLTRNAWRDEARCFAGDAKAQAVALAQSPQDLAAMPVERVFFLNMPLMHAEDKEMQRESVRRFVDLERRDAWAKVDYAIEHAAIVLRFGRFPDRNLLMGRPSTPEEQQFLAATSFAWFEKQGPVPA